MNKAPADMANKRINFAPELATIYKILKNIGTKT
jgi:hypothetical protein